MRVWGPQKRLILKPQSREPRCPLQSQCWDSASTPVPLGYYDTADLAHGWRTSGADSAAVRRVGFLKFYIPSHLPSALTLPFRVGIKSRDMGIPREMRCILSDLVFSMVFSERRGLASQKTDSTNMRGNGIVLRAGKYLGRGERKLVSMGKVRELFLLLLFSFLS